MKQENSHPSRPPEPGSFQEPPGANTLAFGSSAQVSPAASGSISVSDRDHEINKELQRLNRALRALSACNQALAQAGSEPVLLSDICDIIVRMGAYRFTWIGYAQNDEKKTVTPVAYAGHENGYLDQIDVRWTEDDPAGRGPSGTAIRENRICVVLNTARDPLFAPWRDTALERGYAAVIALPLRTADRAFGVLMIYSDQVGSFEHSEMELLTEMANNLAFGITAIRSQEEGKRATVALREAEAKYRQLVEEVPAISYVAEAGAQGRFLYLSPQVEKILGYRSADCMSDPWFWWNHLNPQDHPIAQLEDTWEEGRPFRAEYRMRRQDGREVWIRDEAVIFREERTNKRLIRGLMVDITEQKLANEALRESEERYRAFVEQSSEGIFRMEYDPPVPCSLPVLDQIRLGHERGYVAECNDAMAKIFGFPSAKELIGKPLAEFLVLQHPETRQFMERFIRSGYRITDQESQEVDAHGQGKIFRNTMIGILADNCWVRTWGISRDVTERLHLEEQLRNAQQLEAIGRLAGGVAHDFNNILSIIMGHGELLLAAGVDERTKNGLEQMRRASLRAASLTQQLLAFSRKQVLQPRILDLNEAVADVQNMLARVIGEDIELVANLQPSLMSVKVDPGQVEQVLMNLAINARDAMPQGGKLTMETANVTIGPEEARDLDLAPGPYVMLKVSDTGHGMDSSTVPHIFEPFFTTKPVGKGTGLGLATVYGIVKQSGGSIQVQSEPERGSTFRVYFPSMTNANPRKEDPRNGDKGAAAGTETVLIAEDEPDLRELTRIFLESYGYRVLTAASAELAIQAAQNYSGHIHLLLTDVIMPGMSGSQLAEKIQIGRPEIRIVYMTGYTDDMVVQHKVLEPGVQLLQKPFTKADLALKVRATLDAE
ncbi:MAG TPA: PAS domain S-box protein [Candidatus Sulfotelmatobacter sp.]|nr:PAS domain S-box protein [Candidatus Sulfotelmatobacter sp.]